MSKRFLLISLGILSLTFSELYGNNDVSSFENTQETCIDTSEQNTQVFFTGDFLYWQASQDGLEIGQTGESIFDTFPLTSAGTFKALDFEYTPGFKVGVGLNFPYNRWDTYLNYVWLQSLNNTGTLRTKPGEGALIAFNSDFLDLPRTYPDTTSGQWKLYFNTLDWEFGKNFSPTKNIPLRLHIGLKGVWMDQNYTVETLSTRTIYHDTYENSFQKQRFYGIGLRTGFNAQWIFLNGFSLYSNFAFGDIYGSFFDKIEKTMSDPLINSGIPYTETFISTKFSGLLQLMIELTIGVRYNICFGKNKASSFMIQAGWEQQFWYEQNNLLESTGPEADLLLQGLDIKVGFTF